MPGPINDDLPFHLSVDAANLVAEILEEYEPSGPDEYDRLADEAIRGAKNFDGGPKVAEEVATELRRRAKAMRDAQS